VSKETLGRVGDFHQVARDASRLLAALFKTLVGLFCYFSRSLLLLPRCLNLLLAGMQGNAQ